MHDIPIPEQIATNSRQTVEGAAWLDRLPRAISDLKQRWSLILSPPFEEEASCSWVAPCVRQDGTPAVLKIGLPHMEAENEIDGLLFWDGDPTVFVLEADLELNAILLERCEPGTTLRERPENEQDQVIAKLLKRLWRTLPSVHPFRPLSEMIAAWVKESAEQADRLPDAGLAKEGLCIFEALLNDAPSDVLLATDLHAGNVLRARREPWLVIDPKPFYGDPAYDATQHLLNCKERLGLKPITTISRFADLLGVDAERVRLWTFARLASTSGGDWHKSQDLARRLMSTQIE
jgi:streptomycin 6-kinase